MSRREYTETNGLWGNERSVSPVIATVLMVAITVVIAGAIGATVIDTGTSASEPAPQASFEFEFEKNATDYVNPAGYAPSWGYDMDRLTVRHIGGDDIPSENVRIKMDGTEVKFINRTGYLGDLGSGYEPGYTFKQIETDESFSAGDSFVVVTFPEDEDQPNVAGLNEASAQIVYEPDSSDRSMPIASWEGPDYE
ncbi:type IV pilin [Halohasta salina]|uniref:type IV pilin n=1 Tax=Halohasta salina TaxID=2961621 RepID=UPI0020A46448|nr:type IV pilin [Halohasta salina]